MWNACFHAGVTLTGGAYVGVISVPGLDVYINQHYEPVLRLAELIVRHVTIRHEVGALRAPSFLVDMNLTYQEFLSRLFAEQALAHGLRLIPARSLYLDEGHEVRIKPDIMLSDGKTIRVAIDAKYKRIDPEADVYQALAYAKALKLERVALVYPADGEVVPATHEIRNDQVSILVRTVPVVPDDTEPRSDSTIERIRSLARCHATGGIPLTKFTTIRVGKPLNLDDLKKKSTPRSHRANPRDEDLTKLVNEVSVGAASQVLPWHFEGKAATARAAASKVIKAAEAAVYVSSRPDMPGVLLFSRVPLSGRQGKGGATGR